MAGPILIPLDGSQLSERALPSAQALASATGGHLLLLRAVVVHAPPSLDPATATRRALQEAQTYLAAVSAGLPRQYVVESAVFFRDAAEAILAEARLRRVGMIVMSTHGRSGLNRLLHGSVAHAVLARAEVPVFVVRAWQEVQPLRLAQPRPPLLVPLDGSVFAAAALTVAQELATTVRGELVLLHAVAHPETLWMPEEDRPGSHDAAAVERRSQESERYLEQVKDRLLEDGCTVPVSTVSRIGHPVEVIETESRARGFVTVVMATHGRTGLSDLVLGSVAEDLVRRGTAPLLLVRPPEAPSVTLPHWILRGAPHDHVNWWQPSPSGAAWFPEEV